MPAESKTFRYCFLSVSDPASDAPTLAVSGGALDGRSITLDRSVEVVLGSGQSCHFRLELSNIDADHAHVRWDERGVLISDFGSSTGTYVNGEKVGADHPLQDGDRIFLGPPGSKQSAKIVVKVPATALAAAPLLLEPTVELVGSDEPLILDEGPATPAPVVILDAPPPAAAPAARPAAPAPASPAPPPAPPAPPPPAASAPAGPVAKPSEPRKPKPEYTSDMPSMVGADHVREQLAVPPVAPVPVAKKPPRGAKGLSLPPIPRWAVLGAVAAVLTIGAFAAFRSTQKPPPVIHSITPPKAETGQTVTISGAGFETDAARNVVLMGDQKATIVSASETQIAATIPAVKLTNAGADVPVVVEARGARSNNLFLKVYALPRITSLEPDVAMPGDVVVAKGQELGGQSAAVMVASQPATIVDASPVAVRFRVPELPVAMGRGVTVSVRVGTEAGKPATLLIGRLPLVIGATPSRAMAGERVTIQGRGFDPAPGATTVSFGGVPALVLSTTATESVVAAPGLGAEAQTKVPVSVTVQGKPSSGEFLFTLTRPPAAAYVPRYFPASVPEHAGHDHVFISTEMGPALLLSGKADARATAERGEKVATALNALVEAAVAGRPAAVELRDKPAPGVAVAGSATPFVIATSADAAGYDEAWDPAAKGRRSTPQQIAAFWAALLQDHLTLFVKFQRPYHVLELSPRGKVFTDVYAEATRRARGASGVPLAMVHPLTPSLARSFREMALSPPAGGEAQSPRAAAAIEGHWLGTMTEGDVGSRPIDVRLKVDGGRLVGTLTSRSGKLTMDIPLREASYDKGTLRFLAVVGGAPKHFVGTLQVDAINGTIHAKPDAKDALGSFSLKFVQ
jgi:hypothetical protein